MEFGSLNNMIFFIFPLLLLFIYIFGMKKKGKILKYLEIRNNNITVIVKGILLVLGTILVVFALLSPQKQLENEEIKVKGLNIYALIDTSRSMMTEDVYPNRLEMTKKVLGDIIKNLKGDRIGFIPFSDSAYIQMPLTDDYGITKNYINALDSNLISGGGTQLYQALELAEKSFEEMQSNNKTVIVFSDGGDFDKRSLDFIKKNNITVYTVGIGTNSGSVIPEYKNGSKIGFIKDNSGSAVISKLNSKFLQEIAKEGNGKYYEVNNIVDTTKTFSNDIAKLERKDNRKESVKNYKRYYQIPLGIGLLLILLGYLLKEVKKDEK
ncbi:vWA domain-containing protein [Fusobacterium sp.]|uniref:vWA domain-containing protein n=1 Tax=Fusobacterium sp. TaxID=68766 RepID=UPI00396CA257